MIENVQSGRLRTPLWNSSRGDGQTATTTTTTVDRVGGHRRGVGCRGSVTRALNR